MDNLVIFSLFSRNLRESEKNKRKWVSCELILLHILSTGARVGALQKRGLKYLPNNLTLPVVCPNYKNCRTLLKFFKSNLECVIFYQCLFVCTCSFILIYMRRVCNCVSSVPLDFSIYVIVIIQPKRHQYQLKK